MDIPMGDIEKASQVRLNKDVDDVHVQQNSGNAQSLKHSEAVVADIQSAEGNSSTVKFAPGDPEDPQNWSIGVKWAATLALSAQGFNRIMISTVRADLGRNAYALRVWA
jgi:hypothetical protein